MKCLSLAENHIRFSRAATSSGGIVHATVREHACTMPSDGKG